MIEKNGKRESGKLVLAACLDDVDGDMGINVDMSVPDICIQRFFSILLYWNILSTNLMKTKLFTFVRRSY